MPIAVLDGGAGGGSPPVGGEPSNKMLLLGFIQRYFFKLFPKKVRR